MRLHKSNRIFVSEFRCRTISACHEKILFCSVFCYFLFALSQSNDFVCLNSSNPSVINNCKLVSGKSGLKGSKGEKGEPGGIRPKQIKSLEGMKL